MFVLGIVLLILGGGLGSAAFIGARGETVTIPLRAFGFSRDATPLELFVIGAAAALMFCIGWALVAAALRRRARIRREDHERERIAQLQHQIESERANHEREIESERADHERETQAQRAEYESHLERAALRDEDLRRRDDELSERSRHLEAQEHAVNRLEVAYKEQVRPSVADVVTGRARGQVSQGTAEWTDVGASRTTDTTDATDASGTTDTTDASGTPDRTDASGTTDRHSS